MNFFVQLFGIVIGLLCALIDLSVYIVPILIGIYAYKKYTKEKTKEDAHQ